MKTLPISLSLLALLSAGCMYYPADAYYGPYHRPPGYYQRHPRHAPLDDEPQYDEEGNVVATPGQGGPGSTPPPDVTDPEPPPSSYKTPPVKPEKPNTSNAPTAQKGSVPGRVKNPFKPNEEIDVTGFPSGSLAKDPATGKVFRVP